MRKTNDFLQKKTIQLQQLQKNSQSALDMVTTTINGLQAANTEIESVVAEIQEYKAGLSLKESELVGVQSKNARIIENFTRLING